ncbi:MAG: GGDEF domain-containing protein [Chloroflexi bacterium]|nr:MAG: GGDEF domain-containing protein [Chloroflexota bacterium]
MHAIPRKQDGMSESAAHSKPMLDEERLTREESMIRRVAWVGGVAVTLVTAALLLPLLASATSGWQYPVYSALGGIPLAYGLFSSLVLFKMQVVLLHRHQAQLLMRVSELKEVASRDEMTGLHNRRHFYEVSEEELTRAQQRRDTLAILLMDLDGLKGINDEFGHGVGDIVITNLAAIISKHIRTTDVAARLGGDEFGVVMPGTDKRGAFALARRLWEEMERKPMYEDDETELMVTVSIGVAGYPWGGDSLDEMLHWADADMYANKMSRRLPEEPESPQELDDAGALIDDYALGN